MPSTKLNGKHGETEILGEFTKYYKNVALPSTPNIDDTMRHYSGKLINDFLDVLVMIRLKLNLALLASCIPLTNYIAVQTAYAIST